MKTVPDIEDMDCEQETYDLLMENWDTPEADRFGTWYDWDEIAVGYLIAELGNGFFQDGNAVAAQACDIAQALSSEKIDCCAVESVMEVMSNILYDIQGFHAEVFDSHPELQEAATKAAEILSRHIDFEARSTALKAQLMELEAPHKMPDAVQ